MKRKILIADDEPSNVRLLGELLKDSYDIFVADNGQQVMELAAAVCPDIILLDVMMPRVDGYSACRMLKENSATSEIPVIFITAKTASDDIVRGFEVGGQDYVPKPFNPQELFARVRTHIELKTAQERLRDNSLRLEDVNRKLSAALDQMEIMARQDPLTGLANRRYMLDRLEQEAARAARYGKKLSVAMADIDDFKAINDSRGHECGDLVLKTVSNIMKESIRTEDMVARWGGEEFLFLFPETPVAGASVIAEKIRGLVESAAIMYRGREARVTVTFGIAEYAPERSIDENISRADNAMYRGKKSSKNTIIAEH